MKHPSSVRMHFQETGRMAMFTLALVVLPQRSTTSSQAINLNVELHSLAVFLSFPFDVTSKAKDQRL